MTIYNPRANHHIIFNVSTVITTVAATGTQVVYTVPASENVHLRHVLIANATAARGNGQWRLNDGVSFYYLFGAPFPALNSFSVQPVDIYVPANWSIEVRWVGVTIGDILRFDLFADKLLTGEWA